MTERPQKITFGEMRDMGVRGVLIYCADYTCSHSVAVMAHQWADDVRLSDIEDRFTCTICGKRGADVRPDFNWNRQPVKAMGIVEHIRARHKVLLLRQQPIKPLLRRHSKLLQMAIQVPLMHQIVRVAHIADVPDR